MDRRSRRPQPPIILAGFTREQARQARAVHIPSDAAFAEAEAMQQLLLEEKDTPEALAEDIILFAGKVGYFAADELHSFADRVLELAK